MCGIAGIIGKRNFSKDEIRGYLDRLKYAIAHRGPDDDGQHICENSGFIHTRLSIVDRGGGHQPIFNKDKSIGIIFNGEIYNYNYLKEILVKQGHSFFTKTDTEVILKAYEEYGTDSFDLFNGMFSFCIWDSNKNTIYLVRDPFGTKPLYIYNDNEKIIFASELKGILSLPNIDLSLEYAGFQDYLTFRYIQAPYTFFKKIKRVEAGTYYEIKKGKLIQYRYWDPKYREPYITPDIGEVKEEFEHKLYNAVKSQLMGEAPIGALLSGGIDSSSIAYFIHKCGANLTTFNIGFPEVNEFEFSTAVAKDYGLKHVQVLTTVEELIKSFERIMTAIDEPIADPACFPLYRLCEELKQHVTVILSGEGGDEILGGYPQYLGTITEGLCYNDNFSSFIEKSWYFKDNNAFFNDPFLPVHTWRFKKYFEEQPLLNGMLAYDIKTWIPENLMMKADKILMSHSLEGRFPFLDKELFEFMANQPQIFKINQQDGKSKWLLRELMEPYLPESVLSRPKMGFSVPISRFLQEMKPVVMNVANSLQDSILSEVLNSEHIKNTFYNYYENKTVTDLQAWTLFVMSYWFLYTLPAYRSMAVTKELR